MRISVDQALQQPTRLTTGASLNLVPSQQRRLSAEWTSPEMRIQAPTFRYRIRTRSTATATAHTYLVQQLDWVSMLTARLFSVHMTPARCFSRSVSGPVLLRGLNCTP